MPVQFSCVWHMSFSLPTFFSPFIYSTGGGGAMLSFAGIWSHSHSYTLNHNLICWPLRSSVEWTHGTWCTLHHLKNKWYIYIYEPVLDGAQKHGVKSQNLWWQMRKKNRAFTHLHLLTWLYIILSLMNASNSFGYSVPTPGENMSVS